MVVDEAGCPAITHASDRSNPAGEDGKAGWTLAPAGLLDRTRAVIAGPTCFVYHHYFPSRTCDARRFAGETLTIHEWAGLWTSGDATASVRACCFFFIHGQVGTESPVAGQWVGSRWILRDGLR